MNPSPLRPVVPEAAFPFLGSMKQSHTLIINSPFEFKLA